VRNISMKANFAYKKRSGYTLIEVLAAAGIISAAIGAASALGMNMTKQEELARGHLAAIRYAESISKLWQLGVSPSAVILAQTQGAEGSTGFNPMTWSIGTVTNISLGDDGGVAQGTVEKTTVSVTYLPYGANASDHRTVSLNVIRPVALHR
jgi:prepilin-type N-terminal cleavage/methylation domain-containing protein